MSGILILILGLGAIVGTVWAILELRNFDREEKAYEARQSEKMALIEEALKDGVEVVQITPRMH